MRWMCALGLAAALGAASASFGSVNHTYAEAFSRDSYSASGVGADNDMSLDDATPPATPGTYDASSSIALDDAGFDMVAASSASVTVGASAISGSASVTREWVVPQGETLNATSEARARADFTLAQASAFTLTTTHFTDGPVMAGMFFRIFDQDNGGAIIYSVGGANVVSSPFQDSGMLTAGSYRVELSLLNGGSFAGQGERTQTMEFTFAIPSPGAAGLFGLGALGAVRRRR